MDFRLTLTKKLTPKLKLTPQMMLSLNLLQLPLLKLKEFINQQYAERLTTNISKRPVECLNCVIF